MDVCTYIYCIYQWQTAGVRNINVKYGQGYGNILATFSHDYDVILSVNANQTATAVDEYLYTSYIIPCPNL